MLYFCYVVGDVTSLATIPQDVEVEAQFLAKEDGVIAGIGLAEMVFHQVDPSLKVLYSLHTLSSFSWLFKYFLII